MIDKQETFDTVLAHLREQGEPAMRGIHGDCAYRGEDGTKCAVGCLISDEEYDEVMEGRSFEDSSSEGPGYDELYAAVEGHDIRLLTQLQNAHDGPVPMITERANNPNWVSDWQKEVERRCAEIAINNSLHYERP